MWFKMDKQQVTINVFVKPNAKKTALQAIANNELHISLHAKPHQGEANKELIDYFALLFRISKSNIIFKGGKRSRHKKVSIPLTKTVQQFLDNPNTFIL